MNKPISVGITGGIGAGKTMVTKLFSLLNVPIYNADLRAKELMNTQLVDKITNMFGDESYNNGTLNRDFLAKKVFSHPASLKKLNAIVHPAIAIDFEGWRLTQNQHFYVLKEAALLVETKSYKQLDKLIVVISSLELRKKRILKRDGFRSAKEIEQIIENQSSDEEKIDLSDFIIYNNETQLLIPQVMEIDKKIRQCF